MENTKVDIKKEFQHVIVGGLVVILMLSIVRLILIIIRAWT